MDEAFRSIAHRLGGHLAQSRRLHGGVSSDVFALEIAREGAPTLHVVARGHRTSRSRADDPRLAAREHALLTALVEAGLEVPRPLLLEPAPDRVGGAWLVMELVPGTSAVPVDALPAALPQMARFLSALHALDPSQLTLPELPAREDPVAGALTYLPDAG